MTVKSSLPNPSSECLIQLLTRHGLSWRHINLLNRSIAAGRPAIDPSPVDSQFKPAKFQEPAVPVSARYHTLFQSACVRLALAPICGQRAHCVCVASFLPSISEMSHGSARFNNTMADEISGGPSANKMSAFAFTPANSQLSPSPSFLFYLSAALWRWRDSGPHPAVCDFVTGVKAFFHPCTYCSPA